MTSQMIAPPKEDVDPRAEPEEVEQQVMLLGRDQILSAPDLKMELLEVPEWGGAVYVRSMTGQDRDRVEAALVGVGGKHAPKNMRALVAQMVCCNADGERIFAPSDVQALSEKSAAALERIFDLATKMNALSEQDVEELEGN